jgi:hypothetical protein
MSNAGIVSPAEAELVSRILDCAEPWGWNYFRLRKALGPYLAGDFVDRITLEVLLNRPAPVVAS